MWTRINWEGTGWYKEHLISSGIIEFRLISGDRSDKQFINNISYVWVHKSLSAIAKFDEINILK